MPDKLKWTLQSKKFWAFVTAFVGLGFASYQNDGVITVGEIETLVYLVIGYIASVALEDGLSNRNATTTTLTTPSDNVTVSTSETATPAPTPRMLTADQALRERGGPAGMV